MRKPRLREFKEDDGQYDHEGYDEAMGDYADAERDREIEERFEEDERQDRIEEKEHYADHSDQEKEKWQLKNFLNLLVKQ